MITQQISDSKAAILEIVQLSPRNHISLKPLWLLVPKCTKSVKSKEVCLFEYVSDLYLVSKWQIKLFLQQRGNRQPYEVSSEPTEIEDVIHIASEIWPLPKAVGYVLLGASERT